MDVGLGPDDFMLDGDPAPLPKKGAEPPAKFLLAHAYCGQTAGWIKMALRMEVGLGPGHIVLDGEPVPLPQKGAEPPIFGPWHGGRPQPSRLCGVRWGPSRPSSRRGQSPLPNFRPISIVAKRLDAPKCHLVWS